MQSHLSRNVFTGPHCWQYEIRQRHLEKDLESLGCGRSQVESLRISDFKFQYVPKEDRETCQQIKEFIIRHEWLGKMPHRPTQRFMATYKGKLAGVIVMATPNAFSNFLGKESRDKEKLISRGASISWSPKNLGSALLMFSIRWMAQNTQYRFFTGYSDTEAKELGTIYQACNFIYLGQKSGAKYQYFDPSTPEEGWFTDRIFRKTTSIKKYAHTLGISWQREWQRRDQIYWDKMPERTRSRLKRAAQKHQSRCMKKKIPRKHKYLYILGKSKRETLKLRTQFKKRVPFELEIPYPKIRGRGQAETLNPC